jgi:hypothetical protein
MSFNIKIGNNIGLCLLCVVQTKLMYFTFYKERWIEKFKRQNLHESDVHATPPNACNNIKTAKF